jgi:hypothetical protein
MDIGILLEVADWQRPVKPMAGIVRMQIEEMDGANPLAR